MAKKQSTKTTPEPAPEDRLARIEGAAPILDLIQYVTVKELIASPDNPRRVRDDAAIDELAESIMANGLLQNLVVRESDKHRGKFEVIAGGRRLEALGRLVRDKRIDDDYQVAVRITRAEAGDARRAALVENIQRETMHPMDEAESIVGLLDAGASSADLAAQLGKTQRWIQIRASIGRKLSDQVKAALREDRLSIAQAKVLTLLPTEKQAEPLKAILKDEPGYDHENTLRARLTQKLVPAARAIFPLDRYTGEYVIDDFAEGDTVAAKMFADFAQFERLQREACEEKRAEFLAEGWSWCEVFDNTKNKYSPYDVKRGVKDKAKAGVAITLHYDLKVGVETGLQLAGRVTAKHKAGAGKGGHAAGGNAADSVAIPNRPQLIAAKHIKSRALRAAVAEDLDRATLVAVLAMLGAETIALHSKRIATEAIPEITAERFPEIAAAVKKLTAGGAMNSAHAFPFQLQSDRAAFDLMRKWPAETLNKLFAELVALHVGAWPGLGGRPDSVGREECGKELGDAPLVLAMAQAWKPNVLAHWKPDHDYLSALTKQQLQRIGHHLKVDREALFGKTGELVAAILAAPALDKFLPPEVAFGDEDSIVAAIAALPLPEKTKASGGPKKKAGKAKADGKPKAKKKAKAEGATPAAKPKAKKKAAKKKAEA